MMMLIDPFHLRRKIGAGWARQDPGGCRQDRRGSPAQHRGNQGDGFPGNGAKWKRSVRGAMISQPARSTMKSQRC